LRCIVNDWRVLQNKRNNRFIKAWEDFFAQECAKFKGARVKFGRHPLRIASNLTR
jgi:hypothetical protein